MRADPRLGVAFEHLKPAPPPSDRIDLVQVPHDDPAWATFVASRREARPFHHSGWSQAIAECYGYEPFAFVVSDQRGEILAGLPMMEVPSLLGRPRWLSLPFTDSCPPLAPTEDLRDELIVRLEERRRREGLASAEIRSGPLAPGIYTTSDAVTHRLALEPDADAVRRRFSQSQFSRNIARAERAGVTVVIGDQRDDLTERYYSLHVRTRRRQGIPVQPRRFFELLWEHMIEPGRGFVLLAKAGGGLVAGAVFLAWNETLVYKFGASDSERWSLRPNHAVFWRAIQWGCDHGCRVLDFGKTDLGNAGLRAFKSGWGAGEEPLFYSVLADDPPHPGGDRARRLLGAVIRRSPEFVCRGVGRAFYRYAA